MARGVKPLPEQVRIPLLNLLGEAKDMVVTEVYRRLAEEGFEIRPSHGFVLRCIGEGGSRLTDLADHIGYTKQSVGEVVSSLQRLGYAERVSDPVDGRAKVIQLTDRGRQAQATIERLILEIEARWASEHGQQNLTNLRRSLEQIVAPAH